MLARAPGDVAHANVAQVKRSPPAAGFTPPGLGQRGSVPSYAGSERARRAAHRGHISQRRAVTPAGRVSLAFDLLPPCTPATARMDTSPDRASRRRGRSTATSVTRHGATAGQCPRDRRYARSLPGRSRSARPAHPAGPVPPDLVISGIERARRRHGCASFRQEHRHAVTDIARRSFSRNRMSPRFRHPTRRFYVRALTIDRPRSVTAGVLRPGSAASSSWVGRPVAAAADSAGSLRGRLPGREAGRLGMGPAVVPGQDPA